MARSYAEVELATERLELRPPQLDDTESFVEFADDVETMRWLGHEPGGGVLAAQLVARWVARWEQNGIGYFVVLHDGAVLGRVGFNVWDTARWQLSSFGEAGATAQPELGWALTSRHWGRGYASEAARAAAAWARGERGVERLISLIEPANERSAHVAGRLGAHVSEQVETDYGRMDVWVHPE